MDFKIFAYPSLKTLAGSARRGQRTMRTRASRPPHLQPTQSNRSERCLLSNLKDGNHMRLSVFQEVELVGEGDVLAHPLEGGVHGLGRVAACLSRDTTIFVSLQNCTLYSTAVEMGTAWARW